MAEYKIVTWRRAFLDWRVEVYFGEELIHDGRDFATRGGATRATKRMLKNAFKPPRENPFRRKEEWFHV